MSTWGGVSHQLRLLPRGFRVADGNPPPVAGLRRGGRPVPVAAPTMVDGGRPTRRRLLPHRRHLRKKQVEKALREEKHGAWKRLEEGCIGEGVVLLHRHLAVVNEREMGDEDGFFRKVKAFEDASRSGFASE